MPLQQSFDADIFILNNNIMTTIGWRISNRLVTKAIALVLLESIVQSLEAAGITAQIHIDHFSDYTEKPLRSAGSKSVYNPMVKCIAMHFTIVIEVANAQELFDSNVPLGLGEVLRKTGVVDADKLVDDEIRKQLKLAINTVAAQELSNAMRQEGYKNVVRVFCDGIITEHENQR